ncbi:MAG: SDR family NAD(P)-dependent oxidoreductase [Armatimonadetes bacterium]|nr:MAG: SDR family NAD(P)-dependent oxidoreductase [Armatimonadota bacterium]
MSSPNVAVIPGGTGSVGRCLIPLLLDRGFKIATTYLLPEEAAELEEAVDYDEDRLIIRRVDAVNPDAVASFMAEAADTYGPFNVMASLVGGWAGGRDVGETDDVRLDRMLDLNLRTAWNTTRAAIPHMSEDWARIILMGSKHALDAPAGQAAYNVAKSGVLALAKSVATELLDTNTTCNALLPSVINTDATRAALPYADYVNWPQPQDIAVVINFLASEQSKVINGAFIPVWGTAII